MFGLGQQVESYVCRSTLVPAGDGKGRPPLAAMALSFGDTILGITSSPHLDEVEVHTEFINPEEYPKDIHFYYTTVSWVPPPQFCHLQTHLGVLVLIPYIWFL